MVKAKGKANFDTVRKIGLEFRGVETSTMYGAPALKVRGKLLACIPSHRSAEPGSLVVCLDFADRAGLLAEAPDLYYITNHYVDYPSVLVRLSGVTPGMLRDLLGMAYKFATAPTKAGSRPRKPLSKSPAEEHHKRTSSPTRKRR